jgi:molybdate/tungstate transport system substrate-binding protein
VHAIGFTICALLLVRAPLARAADTVSVLYAGSLVNLMEHGVGTAFDKATGATFQGFAEGSGLLANQIKRKLRHGDVFISALPRVDENLMGASNGGWVSLYVGFAHSHRWLSDTTTTRFAG